MIPIFSILGSHKIRECNIKHINININIERPESFCFFPLWDVFPVLLWDVCFFSVFF